MRPFKQHHEDGALISKTRVKRWSQCGATGENIRAYHCPYGCHAYHIGHPPGSRQLAS